VPACEGMLLRGPVLLMLDAALQVLPWESLPVLQQQRCAPKAEHRKKCAVGDIKQIVKEMSSPGLIRRDWRMS